MSYQDYQQPPYNPYGGPPSQSTSGSATAALILGICGFVVCPLVCSILAIVFAKKAYKEIDASGGRIGGRGLAQAGLILGWIGVALSALGLLFVALWFVLIAASVSTNGFSAVPLLL